jgi:hypothetical protein
MHTIAGLLMFLFVLFAAGASASAQTCEYRGQIFSFGATVCECPQLRISRGDSGGRGEITSRRLTCSKDQGWVNTNTLCLIAYTWPGQAEEAFRKFHATHCPRLPVNHAELQKAVSEETEKFFSTAPRSQALMAVQAICRRFPDLSEPCKRMIEALSATAN